jgi:hypothetical protein
LVDRFKLDGSGTRPRLTIMFDGWLILSDEGPRGHGKMVYNVPR